MGVSAHRTPAHRTRGRAARCPAVFLLAMACVAPPALAQRVEVDPCAVLGDMRAYYTGGPPPERVTIGVRSDGRVQADSVVLGLRPVGTLSLDFGSYSLRADGSALRVLARFDGVGYFETATGDGGPAGALERLFPPLPLPQVALAFGEWCAPDLTPYTRAVSWKEAWVDADAGRAVVRGEGRRCAVEVVSEAASGRLLRMKATIDGGQTVLEVSSEPAAEEGPRPFEIDAARRERVESVEALVPRPGRVLPGDPLPTMPLERFGGARDEEKHESFSGPGVLVFYRGWAPGRTPRAEIEAAERAAAAVPGAVVWPVLVMDELTAEPMAVLNAALEDVEPRALRHTPVAISTIERFARAAPVAVVVVDREGVVREVVERERPGAGGAPSEAEIGALAERLRRALTAR